MKVLDYKIIYDTSHGRVEKQVLNYVTHGWQLVGGVSIAHKDKFGDQIFAQAVALYESPIQSAIRQFKVTETIEEVRQPNIMRDTNG